MSRSNCDHAPIRAEEARIRQHLKWRDIPDEGARAKSIRAEAEFAAIDALPLERTAARDPRPVDPASGATTGA